jgi:hypothetical protein
MSNIAKTIKWRMFFWAKNILLADKGNIEFNAEAKNYLIEVSTIEAKKIEIKLSIN